MRGWVPRISRNLLHISRGRLARAGDGVPAVRQFWVGHVRQMVAAGVVLVAAGAAVLAITFGGSSQSPGNAAASAQHVVPLSVFLRPNSPSCRGRRRSRASRRLLAIRLPSPSPAGWWCIR